MTNSRRGSALATAALLVSTLVGCNDAPANTPPTTDDASTSAPAPSTQTSEQPSDEDLAARAAEKVVRDYLATVDRLRQYPKASLSELKDVSIGGELDAQTIFTRNQRRAGNRQTGVTKVREVVVQAIDLGASGRQQVPTVQLDVCWDVSGGDVIDRKGNSIVSPDRPSRGWTRYTAANHRWKTHPYKGWRVAGSQDLEKAPC